MSEEIDRDALREKVQSAKAKARPYTYKVEEVEPTVEHAKRRVTDTFEKEIDIFTIYSDIEGYVTRGRFGATVLKRSMVGAGEDVVVRWINTRKENYFLKKVRGYKVVEDKRIQTMSELPGTTHRINELVLCEIPCAAYYKRKEDEQRKGELRRESASAEFREQARKHGVQTFEDTSRPKA